MILGSPVTVSRPGAASHNEAIVGSHNVLLKEFSNLHLRSTL